MVTVKFKGFPKARAIVLEEPIHKALSGSGVSGVVECLECDCRAGLYEPGEHGIADEIETFVKTHRCTYVTKKTLLQSILEERQAMKDTGIVL